MALPNLGMFWPKQYAMPTMGGQPTITRQLGAMQNGMNAPTGVRMPTPAMGASRRTSSSKGPTSSMPKQSPLAGLTRGGSIPNFGGSNTLGPVSKDTMLGGPKLPGQYRAPSGPMEEALFNFFNQGQPAFTYQYNPYMNQLMGGFINPFVSSLATGQLPPGIRAQLDQDLARQRAQGMEQFGAMGAGAGSDVQAYIAREQGRTLNDAYANAENRALQAAGLGVGTALSANQFGQGNFQQGLQNYLGLGGNLLGVEGIRNMTGLQLLWQEYLQQQGLPPELAALLTAGGLGPSFGTSINKGGGTEGAAIGGAISGLGGLLGGLGGMGGGGGGGGGLGGFGA